jgi:hypothetical protein
MKEMGAPERFEEVVAALQPGGGDGEPPHWGITFAVDDADAIAARAKSLLARKAQTPPLSAIFPPGRRISAPGVRNGRCSAPSS